MYFKKGRSKWKAKQKSEERFVCAWRDLRGENHFLFCGFLSISRFFPSASSFLPHLFFLAVYRKSFAKPVMNPYSVSSNSPKRSSSHRKKATLAKLADNGKSGSDKKAGRWISSTTTRCRFLFVIGIFSAESLHFIGPWTPSSTSLTACWIKNNESRRRCWQW